MSTLFIGQKKIVLPSVDSTNNFAANLIKETNVVDGTVILSEKQTNGRGQSGNSWQSAYGDNITCSYILRPKFLDIEEQFYISIITSLAIISTLKSYGIEPKIKWPNDILVGSRKIAGILIENSISGKTLNHSIIGVGLNVNQTSFDLGISATSIANVTGQIQIKETVLDRLSGNLEKYYLQLRAGSFEDIKAEYLTELYGYGEQLKYRDIASNKTFVGTIVDVENNGPVKLNTGSGIRSYYFKEVELITE